MKGTLLLLSIILISTWLFACTPKSIPAEKTTSRDNSSQPQPTLQKEGWEKEWQQTQEIARKEASLIIVGGAVGSDVRTGVSKVFNEKFHVEVIFLPGRGAEQVEKLTRERRAGIYSADVYVGGATTPTIELKPRGFLEPLEKILFLPEVTDAKNWRYYDGVYYDKGRFIAGGFATPKSIVYANSEQIKLLGDIKSFQDLLDPKWTGKIVINDPTTMGSGKDSIEAIRYLTSDDYLKKLVEQKPAVIRDQRQQVEWLAHGKYAIGLGVPDSIVLEFTRAGAPIAAKIMAEGMEITTGIGAVSFFSNSSHPYSSRLFLNWILTKEGQELFARLAGHASRRADVANEHMPSYLQPKSGIKYAFTDEDIQLRGEERMNFFRELFKSAM